MRPMTRPTRKPLRRRLATGIAGGALIAVLSACGLTLTDASATTASAATTAGTAGISAVDALAENAETHADATDGDYDPSGATTIRLADGATTVAGDGATVDGDVVTVTQAGTYVISGSLSDGQVVVDSTGTDRSCSSSTARTSRPRTPLPW